MKMERESIYSLANVKEKKKPPEGKIVPAYVQDQNKYVKMLRKIE